MQPCLRASKAHGLHHSILACHRILMEYERKREKEPGKIRKMQVFISAEQDILKATYVPSLPEFVNKLLKNLFGYWRNDVISNFTKAAIIHYQFEAIRPFGDGNGRIGRN